jgi:hydrophobe/amphiphile efflux-3 (HAE3) family protein
VAKGASFRAIVRAAARRPVLVLLAVSAASIAGAALALRLEPSAAPDTLVDRSSASFREDERFRRQFGDEAVVVLVKGDLKRTLLTSDLGRLLRLEGCLSGNVPRRALARLPAPCTDIAGLRPAKVVYGPGTFVNTAAGQITDQFLARRRANRREAERLAEAARRASARRGDPRRRQERLARIARGAKESEFARDSLALALRYGLTGLPSIDNAEFVSTLVFDSRAGRAGVPKSRFSYLFPGPDAALIQARLRPDLTEGQRDRAIELIEAAARSPELRPRRGASYVVTGVPVVVKGLASAVERSIVVLLVAAVLVMAATLALVFRTRMRLLPLALALGASAMTFGALSLAGGSLTMASIAVLPVLIGLAVDYAIQFQARFDEARSRRPRTGPAEAASRAATAGGATIATAGLATAAGFLVLLLSPVPMVRGFGALLVLGVLLALACALTAGFAALVRFSGPRRRPADLPPALPRLRARLAGARDAVTATGAYDRAAWRAAAARERIAQVAWRTLDYALLRPRRVLAVGLALAAVGWAVDTQSDVASDVRDLVPQDLKALRDVRELQDRTGVSGEIDVTVRADDITRPEVVGWMTRFQQRVLAAHGYRLGERCGQEEDPPELCPALSLPAIFSSAGPRDQREVRALLDAVPPYFLQGVVSRDRRTANLAFGIRLMPLERQKQVVDDIERRLRPPEGVEAAVVGLPVLAAHANGALSSAWRRALTLGCALAAVFLVLLASRRSGRAAAVPLIPIALATGWSAGLLFLLGLLPGPLEVDVNPMTVTLGALVIAISTEFSVLLTARYREERAAGAGPVRAVELAYASTGAAVLASGATAIAGFAALVASDIKMLRDFGIATVVDLTVSLLGVMVLLPAALMWADQHGRFRLTDLDPRPLARSLWLRGREGSRAARVSRVSAPRRRWQIPGLPRRRREAGPR